MGEFKSREWRNSAVSLSCCLMINIKNSHIWCNNLLYVLYCGNFDTITFYHCCIFKLVYKAFYHLLCRVALSEANMLFTRLYQRIRSYLTWFENTRDTSQNSPSMSAAVESVPEKNEQSTNPLKTTVWIHSHAAASGRLRVSWAHCKLVRIDDENLTFNCFLFIC